MTGLADLRPIAEALAARGGRAWVVGGFVRDRLLGRAPGDLDVEVLGLDAAALEAVLAGFGRVRSFGRAFAVWQVDGLAAQFSLPRRDSLESPPEPALSFAEAARRRDLTVNAIGLDPLTGELADPLGGRADLASGTLRAADPARFADDPLRGLRVAQLAARLGFRPDAELLGLCRGLDLAGQPGDRLKGELDKLLLDAPRPGVGMELLRETGLLRFFPELAALVGVPQDPVWHPEGDVWVHNNLALDAAAALRAGDADDPALMYAVLCHDLGKPATTREEDGRLRSRGHDVAGVVRTRQLLGRLRASNELVARVEALVRHHLAPELLHAQGAKVGAYRRLVRQLDAAGVSPQLLERVARADHLGRTTSDARAGRFPAGDHFLALLGDLELAGPRPPDAVRGAHLLALGVERGPGLGRLLARCRAVQDETGWTDPEAILARVLGGES